MEGKIKKINMEKEIEVKFKINDLSSFQKNLIKLGVSIQKPFFQTTYGFFSKDSIKEGIFPRIRDEKDEIVLTVKVKPKEKSNYFERMEHSVKIKSVEEGINVLKALDFNRMRVFKKIRQECEFLNTKIALDKLYFGDFIEIEGEKEDIEKVINKLGLKSKERITKAYLALEDDYKASCK